MPLSTGCTNLDNLTDGGIPERRVSGIFSQPNLGKSFFSTQLALNAISQGKKVLYLCSKSEYDSRKIAEILKHRFGVEKVPEYKQVKNLASLGRLFGSDITIDYSKDKVSVYIRDLPKRDSKHRTIKYDWTYENFQDYDLVILDSFSELLKLDILVSQLQDLPARSSIETYLFGKFTDACEDFGSTFFLVHHISQSPIGPIRITRPFGGPILMYLSKYLIEMDNPGKKLWTKYGAEARRVRLFRWVGKPRTDWIGLVLKENEGFYGLDDDTLDLQDDEEELTETEEEKKEPSVEVVIE